MPFMTKSFSKEKMRRLRLRNKYLKNKTEENLVLYSQQRNKCVPLLRKTKTYYYGILNDQDIRDNKNVWKNVNPFLSDKSINSDNIYLSKNVELNNSKSKIAEVLNEFFSNVVKKKKKKKKKKKNDGV